MTNYLVDHYYLSLLSVQLLNACSMSNTQKNAPRAVKKSKCFTSVIICWYVQEAEEIAPEEEVGVGLKARRGAEQNNAQARERPHSGSLCWPQP